MHMIIDEEETHDDTEETSIEAAPLDEVIGLNVSSCLVCNGVIEGALYKGDASSLQSGNYLTAFDAITKMIDDYRDKYPVETLAKHVHDLYTKTIKPNYWATR